MRCFFLLLNKTIIKKKMSDNNHIENQNTKSQTVLGFEMDLSDVLNNDIEQKCPDAPIKIKSRSNIPLADMDYLRERTSITRDLIMSDK